MKKKILSISVLLVIMILAFSGCSKTDNPAPAGETYGYTIEDLGKLYDECMLESQRVVAESFSYSQGALDTITPERIYENRITLNSVVINPKDIEFAKIYDDLMIRRSNGDASVDELDIFAKMVINSSDKSSNLEKFAFSYTTVSLFPSVSYREFISSPFDAYQNTN